MNYAERELRNALDYWFGVEWRKLAAADQSLIVRDCTEDGGVDDIEQYRDNVGPGNLWGYVQCLRVRFKVAR